MIDPILTKEVSSVISIEKEISTNKYLSGTSLTFTLCDRNSIEDNRGNYFTSFNLAQERSYLTTGSTLSILHPEQLQLNSDKIIFTKIPSTSYSEYIDGRSIEFSIPVTSSTGTDYYKLYSSTYTSDISLQYGESSLQLGDNVCYLFCDRINPPYTGMTFNDMGQMVSHSAITSWNPTGNIQDRPSAVSYLEVQGSIESINSDRRNRRHQNYNAPAGFPAYMGKSADFPDTDFSGGSLGVYIRQGHGFTVGELITIDKDNYDINPGHVGFATIIAINYNITPPSYLTGRYDFIVTDRGFGTASFLEAGAIFAGRGAYYNYDIPVGFAILDKGFVVLTHKELVNKFAWSASTNASGGTYAGTTDVTKNNLHFNTPSVYLKFEDINTEFKTTAVCMALNNEFYVSNNRTWDRSLGSNEFANNQPVQITEVGLYNTFGELVAVSKFNKPVSKSIDDIFTFNIHFDM